MGFICLEERRVKIKVICVEGVKAVRCKESEGIVSSKKIIAIITGEW